MKTPDHRNNVLPSQRKQRKPNLGILFRTEHELERSLQMPTKEAEHFFESQSAELIQVQKALDLQDTL